ncbi:MAG: hypothetical protein K0R65_2119 [Crocinitomicaceae bacterium]|nr:hypothetical protein [Crocinitomicaceae bacterium]
MKFIELAFRLGVVFAIFGFIWGIFQVILGIFRGGRQKSIMEEYSFKFVQYFFLVDVTFLFCIKKGGENQLLLNELVFSGFILLLYFLGKLQNKQQRISFFQISGTRIPNFKPVFNLGAEIAAIVFAVALFTFFIFMPVYANNPLSNWFYQSILDIEDTFFFGFIFKIIGFFVLVGILMKLLNGLSFLISGKPIASVRGPKSDRSRKDDFDDYEEIN